MTARTALVTGGMGAIGTAIVDRLISDGMRVMAVDHPSLHTHIQSWQALRAQPVTVALIDVGNPDSAPPALAALGAVDVLINAAGITRDARLSKMALSQWQQVIQSNLDSVFFCTQAFFDGMCARGYGRIVNISSINGQRGAFGQTNYAAAKAGMHGFTMSLAQEGAAKGVTVNTVSPGFIHTPMTAAMRPEVLAATLAQVPVGRAGTPAEIAHAVAFLVAEASGYITGINLPVNGGLFISF